jgi:hypothetical protein
MPSCTKDALSRRRKRDVRGLALGFARLYQVASTPGLCFVLFYLKSFIQMAWFLMQARSRETFCLYVSRLPVGSTRREVVVGGSKVVIEVEILPLCITTTVLYMNLVSLQPGLRHTKFKPPSTDQATPTSQPETKNFLNKHFPANLARNRIQHFLPNIVTMASAARRVLTSSWGARRAFAQHIPSGSSQFARQRPWGHNRIPTTNTFRARSYHGGYTGPSGQSWYVMCLDFYLGAQSLTTH